MLRITLFLRSLLFMLLMVVATLIWAPLCFLCAPLPYNKRYFWTSRWNMFVIWAAKVVCGIRYQVKGYENLPDAPVILLSKHQSAWETIFYLYFMPRPLVYVFKKELIYIPLFGWALGLLRMIPINRNKGRDAFAQVVTHGASGWPMVNGSSCSRKAHALQSAKKANTKAAARAWRLKPRRRWYRLR